MRRKQRERERLSDPPEEEGTGLGGWAAGLAAGCVLLLLVAGAIVLAVGAIERFSGGPSEVAAARDGGVIDPRGPDEPDAPPEPDAVEAMRARYRPGPWVRLDSLVPSGRLVPPTLSGSSGFGRTIDSPWIVPGASLEPTSLPPASASDAPSVWHDPSERAGAPLTLVPRAPAHALIRATDAVGAPSITEYAIEFVGYQGHFRLRATVLTELGQIAAQGSDGATIRFAIASAVRPFGGGVAGAGESFPVTMRIAAIDARGRVSPPIERALSVVAVGAGDVEVTLTMSRPTDLDLYVVDPAGVTIFYGNTSSTSGGRLDLDANAACGSNLGIDNEHVFWPTGRAPAGTYRVRVANFESCIGGAPVDFRVTVNACGETAVLTGRFDGPATSQQCMGAADRAWCQDVVAFDVPPCTPVR